jgi:hypothetical protein
MLNEKLKQSCITGALVGVEVIFWSKASHEYSQRNQIACIGARVLPHAKEMMQAPEKQTW